MASRYTGGMHPRQPLPLVWLFSDARNDRGLAAALTALPPGSGFVFRHYHLAPTMRAASFRRLAALARERAHVVLLADHPERAAEWGADGVYGDAGRIGSAHGLLKLAAAHDGEEIDAAGRAGADGVFLSPVFPTRSHPGARPLGVHGFHVLAQRSSVPVIALGGMSPARAGELAWPRWGAIDGLHDLLDPPQPA